MHGPIFIRYYKSVYTNKNEVFYDQKSIKYAVEIWNDFNNSDLLHF